jgi:peptidoglycan hydrolase CwlO-like protein
MPKRKIQAKSINQNLLIHILKDMNKKIDHIHSDINQHGKEITEVKEQIAMSKGGLKVLIGIAAMLGTIFTIWQYLSQK